jgi:hypothetical protein
MDVYKSYYFIYTSKAQTFAVKLLQGWTYNYKEKRRW